MTFAGACGPFDPYQHCTAIHTCTAQSSLHCPTYVPCQCLPSAHHHSLTLQRTPALQRTAEHSCSSTHLLCSSAEHIYSKTQLQQITITAEYNYSRIQLQQNTATAARICSLQHCSSRPQPHALAIAVCCLHPHPVLQHCLLTPSTTRTGNRCLLPAPTSCPAALSAHTPIYTHWQSLFAACTSTSCPAALQGVGAVGSPSACSLLAHPVTG